MVAAPAGQGIRRRLALGLLGGLALPRLALANSAPEALDGHWQNFRSRYLAPEGRLVDSGNKGVSHSEGQGYGMLLAVRADDRASFERMLAWTRRTLKRRGDSLSAWRYKPDQANPVADQNNASDGDLLIAWALLEAGRRWGQAEHLALGGTIGRDILRHVVRRSGGYTLLLPGTRGFDKRDRSIINPSYYIFPAFRVLAQAVPDPAWVRLATDALALLRAGRFGKWQLPPDWVAVSKADGALSLPDQFPPRFSYDAVRVPLYLAWARLGAEPAVADAAKFWADPAHPHLPAWTDLTNNAIAPYAASPGIASVARLAAAQRSGSLAEPRGLPPVTAAPDYYAAVLNMLVRLAWRDIIAPAT